ncbi:MAG: phosphomannomutase/phosphoglucomutase [Phycisphaerales bacterium JB039]
MLGRIFKAYDIRGTYPDLLNDRMAWQIGYGAARFLVESAQAEGESTPMMRNIVVGRDMRESSPRLSDQLISGIRAWGANVIDVGRVDTPLISFAVNYLGCAGGIMVTASHNPPNYNGFKIAGRSARPIGEVSGLAEIRKHAATVSPNGSHEVAGKIERRDLWDAYVSHVRSFLKLNGRKMRVVVDASNAMAGTMIPHVFGARGSEIAGLELIEVNFDNSSGVFAHEPNPLVRDNLRQTQDAVLAEGADIGFCFDGDADRCMVVDEKGAIIGCDHLTALLARRFLKARPGAPVVYDLRSSRAVAEEIVKAGGRPVRGRVGHVFMKQALAREGAVFGGELSGHFYFADNFNADSGAIAMATTLSTLAESDKPLSKLIAPIARYWQSGEVNYELEDADDAMADLEAEFGPTSAFGGEVDHLDGVTIDCFREHGWWLNVRKSNTEPLLRLNAEARDEDTLQSAMALVEPILVNRNPAAEAESA